MKLLTVKQLRDWDAYTISHEPVSSTSLMERAAKACTGHILKNYSLEQQFAIFCGLGNNGGDGLAIARLLAGYGYGVNVIIVRHSDRTSEDFNINFSRLEERKEVTVREISPGPGDLQAFPRETIIIDALLGSGISKPLEGLLTEVVSYINSSGRRIISIDIPTGLPADIEGWDPERYRSVISAHTTLTFQVPKTSFLFPDTGKYCGEFEVLDIGLHPGFPAEQSSEWNYPGREYINSLIRPRRKFDHKGNFGHALLVAGSRGKNGAAILASRACLRSGTGLLTVAVPQNSYGILQTAVPEAMVQLDNSDDYPVFSFSTGKYTGVGVGAGIGAEAKTREGYKRFLQALGVPVVIDADAINLLAELLKEDPGFRIPPQAVLTPHVKEFARLAGDAGSSLERFRLLRAFAKKHRAHIILKGAHSCLASPDGACFFNSTGNAAMAKGGSGDVLTGMITALLAQGYSPRDAAILGMYFHGKAGDAAASKRAASSVIAGDIIEEISIGI